MTAVGSRIGNMGEMGGEGVFILVGGGGKKAWGAILDVFTKGRGRKGRKGGSWKGRRGVPER